MDKELLKQGQKRLSKQRNSRLWWEIVALIAVIVLAGTVYRLTYSASAYAPADESTQADVQETNFAADGDSDAEAGDQDAPENEGTGEDGEDEEVSAQNEEEKEMLELDEYIAAVTADSYSYIKDGDEFLAKNLRIDFEFENGNDVDVSRLYVYTCPENIVIQDALLNPEDGDKDAYSMKFSDGNLMGKYRLVKTEDGKYQIIIRFIGKPGKRVSGYVQFNGTLKANSLKDDGKIHVNFTDEVELVADMSQITNPSDNVSVKYDIRVEKNAVVDKVNNRINYTVTIFSTKGTPNPITLTDQLDNSDGMLDAEKLTITSIVKEKCKYWYAELDNGVSYESLRTGGEAVSVKPKSVGDGRFTLELPGLEKAQKDKNGVLEGEFYTIEYSYPMEDWAGGAKSVSNEAVVTAKNKSTGETVTDKRSSRSSINYSYTIAKSGSLDQDKEEATWTIRVNDNGADIAECYITDDMFKKVTADDITVRHLDGSLADPEEYEIRTSSGKVSRITFLGIGENEVNRNTYVITYTTSTKDETGSSITNKAYLKLGKTTWDHSTAKLVNSQISKKREGSYQEHPGEDTATQQWSVEVKVPSDGIQEGTKIFDYNNNANDSELDQYMTAQQLSELRESTKNYWSLYVCTKGGKDEEYYRNADNYDKFSETDTGKKYYAFYLKAKDTVPRENGSNTLTITYSTTINIKEVLAWSDPYYKNFAYMNGQEVHAEFWYHKGGIVKMDENWNAERTSVSNADGAIIWRIKAAAGKAGLSDRLKVTDRLPEGITLDSADIAYADAETTVPKPRLDYEKELKLADLAYICTLKDNVFSIEFIKQDGAKFDPSQEVVITLHCKVMDAGKTEEGKTISFTNRAVLTEEGKETESNEQTQDWTKGKEEGQEEEPEGDILNKTGKWDSNAQKVSYMVTINPAAKQLGLGTEPLELVDTMKVNRYSHGYTAYPLDTKAVIDFAKVKLFKAVTDENGKVVKDEDGRTVPGEEVSQDLWSFECKSEEYDGEKGWDHPDNIYTLTAKIPDGMALVLQYEYNLTGNFEQWIKEYKESNNISGWEPKPQLDIRNGVSLTGIQDSENNNDINQAWSVSETSGALRTDWNYEFTKVEEGNYGILLQGAAFAVYEYDADGKDKLLDTYVTDENGRFYIKDNAKNADGDPLFKQDTMYYVMETEAPEGYLLPETPIKYYFYFSRSGKNMKAPDDAVLGYGNEPKNLSDDIKRSTVVNTLDATTVTVNKLWKSAGGNDLNRPEGSISVELWRIKEDGTKERVEYGGGSSVRIVPNSDRKWQYTFNRLPRHYKDEESGTECEYRYYVKEVGVDDTVGTGRYIVTYSNDENSAVGAGEITITNQENTYALPATGGMGTKWYTYGGLLLMLLAVSVIVYRTKGLR